MKKIEGFPGVAPQATFGNLIYYLWVNEEGELFFQITENVVDAKNPGSHPNLLFKLIDFSKGVDSLNIKGLNPVTFERESSNDKNAPSFIKSVVDHLLP